jgi:hypothetical protein
VPACAILPLACRSDECFSTDFSTLLSYQGHNWENGKQTRLIDPVNSAMGNLWVALLLVSFSDCQHRNFALAR